MVVVDVFVVKLKATFLLVQWKPLIAITFGPDKLVITLTIIDDYYSNGTFEMWLQKVADNINRDNFRLYSH